MVKGREYQPDKRRAGPMEAEDYLQKRTKKEARTEERLRDVHQEERMTLHPVW